MHVIHTPLAIALILAVAVHAGDELPPNTWVPAKIDAPLPADLPDARWNAGDGYSYSLYRAKTGTVLIRTGIDSKAAGYSPGYYTNTTVEWDLRTDRATIVEIAAWGGGSYGGGKLLPAYRANPSPSPRHTYDGICYVEDEDALYMMHGATWKTGSNAEQDAKEAVARDENITWRYAFAERTWTAIDGSIRQFWNGNRVSPYEGHLRHWPAGGKLLYLNADANCHAVFDLKARTWQQVELAGKAPMSVYGARSAWDGKRQLWVFRRGPQACTFDPATRTFAALPELYAMPNPPPKDEKDPRRGCQGIAYNSQHDVYMAGGPTGDDTWVLQPGKDAWTNLKAGALSLGTYCYMQYDPKTDTTVMSGHLGGFKLRYVPGR